MNGRFYFLSNKAAGKWQEDVHTHTRVRVRVCVCVYVCVCAAERAWYRCRIDFNRWSGHHRAPPAAASQWPAGRSTAALDAPHALKCIGVVTRIHIFHIVRWIIQILGNLASNIVALINKKIEYQEKNIFSILRRNKNGGSGIEEYEKFKIPR